MSVTDAIVVGAGPNGLAAAVTLARAGLSVVVLEAEDSAGGGCRSEELTLPGFVHDVCSAIHPLGGVVARLRRVAAGRPRADWVHPGAPAAHPLPGGRAAMLERTLDATVEGLGAADGRAWRRLVGPFVDRWDDLTASILGPMLRVPRHPITLTRFGLKALWPAPTLARRAFDGEEARALFGGMAAHAILDLGAPLTSSFGLTFVASGNAVGWPAAKGGSQSLTDALVSYLRSLGGEVVTGQRVTSLDDLPPARAVLFDLTPRQVTAIAGDRLRRGVRRRFERFRYGPGSFKVDYAMDGPVPWTAEECSRAGTVHVGGTFDEVVAAERDVARGRRPERPFVLTSQPTVFDPSRAPAGKHTFWAYCHVPHGSTVDMTGPSRPSSSASPPASATSSSPATPCARPTSSATTPTTWAATWPAAPTAACNWWPGPGWPSIRTGCRSTASTPTCARRRPRPAPASTACAAGGPPSRPSRS